MEHQHIYYKTSDIKRLIPILEKYFGLGIGYFSTDLQFLLQKESLHQDEKDNEWEFINYVTPQEFKVKWIECFNNGHFEPIYMEALYFFANIIHSDPYYAREESILDGVLQDDIMYWDYVRKDLLKLYIFVNDPKIRKSQSLVIQHLTGKLELENQDGWFINRMSADYLSKYLSDITSIEQAKNELKSYNKVAGRQVQDRREPVIMCGLYYLLHDALQLKYDIPNILCEFIDWFLKAVGCSTIDEYNNLTVRTRLTYFLRNAQLWRFHFSEIRKSSDEKLKEASIRRY